MGEKTERRKQEMRTKKDKFLVSWKNWRENHHPKSAFTLLAFRQYMAEFVGTALFVYAATGTVVAIGARDDLTSGASNIAVALAFGFAIAAIVYATANVSGGHLNPAITLALSLTSNKNIFKGFFYIVAQLVGGMVGSALLRATTARSKWEITNLGATAVANDSSVTDALFMEMILTFLLVFVVFGTIKTEQSKQKGGMGNLAGLAIGLAVLVIHLVGNSFTGPSVNPARSLGPAVASGFWKDHWIYWVGPLIGGVAAGFFYQFVIQPDPEEPSPENKENGTARDRKRDSPDISHDGSLNC
eukprot:TRINITY_DN7223_c0_g1_i1.p1 TRINITY_DN7223_c0_g1~~TRINITY_DN7223_c0_g1_i1.p1  ORF type:complete len:301 (+),score=84.35 TRINITY_DN7223_c0_g1_i1:289-1191(+)